MSRKKYLTRRRTSSEFTESTESDTTSVNEHRPSTDTSAASMVKSSIVSIISSDHGLTALSASATVKTDSAKPDVDMDNSNEITNAQRD